MSIRIDRALTQIDGAWVHHREAGAGCQVLLLHQSPQHSAALLPLFEALGHSAHIMAPDLPGYGLSDLPPGRISVQSMAMHLVKWLEERGLCPTIVYGIHTGALVALELAAAIRPESMVLDGLPLFTADERKQLGEHYFPDLTPVADGTHLVTLWRRFYDQFRYFPWYATDRPFPGRGAPDPAAVQAAIDEAMISGGRCWAGYRAAIAYELVSARVAQLRGSVTLLYRPDDPLHAHRLKLPKLPANICVSEDGDALRHLRLALAAGHHSRNHDQ